MDASSPRVLQEIIDFHRSGTGRAPQGRDAAQRRANANVGVALDAPRAAREAAHASLRDTARCLAALVKWKDYDGGCPRVAA